MLSPMLATSFSCLCLFLLITDNNAQVTCTTKNEPLSQIHFTPGVLNINRNIVVSGNTKFPQCTLNGKRYGTAKLVIPNNLPANFSCFNIYTRNLTAFVTFSKNKNRRHDITLIPDYRLIGTLPPNFSSFFLNLTYIAQFDAIFKGATSLKVVFNYQKNLPSANPAVTCFTPGLKGLNGTAILTIQ